MNYIYDVIILGGGPAGMSASVYIGQSYNTLIISEYFGGQLANTEHLINFLGFEELNAKDFISRCMKQMENLPKLVILRSIIKEVFYNDNIYIIKTGKGYFYSKTIIISTGAEPIYPNLDSVKYTDILSKCLYTCALCDGFFMKDKDIIVLGGGNKGFEEALYLSKIAKNITIIHKNNYFKAALYLQEIVEKSTNIKTIKNSTVIDINYNKEGKSIFTIKNLINDSKSIMYVDAIFISIGSKPNLSIIKNLDSSLPSIFFAGDVIKSNVSQAIIAASSGAIAAISCSNFLSLN